MDPSDLLQNFLATRAMLTTYNLAGVAYFGKVTGVSLDTTERTNTHTTKGLIRRINQLTVDDTGPMSVVSWWLWQYWTRTGSADRWDGRERNALL